MMLKVGDKVESLIEKENLNCGAIGEVKMVSPDKDCVYVKFNNYECWIFVKDIQKVYKKVYEEKSESIKEKTYKIHELEEGVEYKATCNVYKIKQGTLFEKMRGGGFITSGLSYNTVLSLEFTECEFEPKPNEEYFFPSFVFEEGYENNIFLGTRQDRRIKRSAGIYRTKEQAQAKAKELGWL